jgi:hypothetical protein
MQKHYRYLLLLLALVYSAYTPAQNITLNTATLNVADDTATSVSFQIQNSSPNPLSLYNLKTVLQGYGNTTVQLWYRSDLSGVHNPISSAQGWTLASTAIVPAVAYTAQAAAQSLFTHLQLVIPANSTYTFALVAQGNNSAYLRVATPSTGPIVISQNNCHFLSGTGIGYAGYGLPPQALSNTLKTFVGSLHLIPFPLCTGSPNAALVSGPNTVCAQRRFSLSASNTSVAQGIQHQWQYLNGSTWTNIAGATQTTLSLNNGITTNTSYRLQTLCTQSGITVYSNTHAVTVSNNALAAGLYTINNRAASTSTNFLSFNDAAAALQCGIAGPITLSVDPHSDPYTEAVLFQNIAGTSASNRITLKGNGATLQYQAGPVALGDTIAVLGLKKTHYFSIDSLVIRSLDTATGLGIALFDSCRYDSVQHCFVDMRSIQKTYQAFDTTTSLRCGISLTNDFNKFLPGYVKSSANCYVGHNTVLGSAKGGLSIGINDGYSVMILYGIIDSNFVLKGNTIAYNTLQDFGGIGICTNYKDSTRILHNTLIQDLNILKPYNTTGITLARNNYHATTIPMGAPPAGCAVEIAYNFISGIRFTNNAGITQRIGATTSTAAGIDASSVYSGNQTPIGSTPNRFYPKPLVHNNIITHNKAIGILCGFIQRSNSTPDTPINTYRIYHNTINVENDSIAEPDWYLHYTGIRIYYRNGTSLPLSWTSSSMYLYNNLITLNNTYSNKPLLGRLYDVLGNYNYFSVQRNPTYFYQAPSGNQYYAVSNSPSTSFMYDNNPYTTYAQYVNNYPTHEVGTVNVDPQYANTAQGDYTPTNPALFFTGSNVQAEVPYDFYGNPRPTNPTPGAVERGADAAITQLISPTGTFCSSNKSVQITFQNMGIFPITTATIAWSLNGVMQTPYTYTGSLAPNATTTLTLGNGLFLPNIPVTIKAWPQTLNGFADYNALNDTLTAIAASSSSIPVQLGNDTTICAGNSLVLQPGYTNWAHLWDNGSTQSTRTVTQTGTYYVRVTALDGCLGFDTIQVQVQALPVVDLGPDIPICEGQSAILDAGNPGATYLWDNGTTTQQRTVDTAGYYTVAVTDQHQCTGHGGITLIWKNIPRVQGLNATHTDSGLYTFYPLQPQYVLQYTWNFGDGTPEVNGFSVQHQYQQVGIYTVTLSLEGECDGLIVQEQKTVDVFVTTGLADQEASSTNSIHVYPNPSQQYINIKASQNILGLWVYNSLGQKVFQTEDVNNNQYTLSTLHFPNGLYTLKAQTKQGTYTLKFEVMR